MDDQGLGTLVTFNPCAVRGGETLDELAGRLNGGGFHHWPVVDDQRRMIGMISDTDVVQHLAAWRTAQSVDRAATPTTINTTASELMSRRVIAIDLSATPEQALQRLLEHEIHSLPVLDGQQLVGIVTTTDFLREISAGEMAGHRDPISRHMLKTPESIDATATLDEARLTFVTTGLRYLPVTKGECPLGVISQRMLRKAKCQTLLTDSEPEATSNTEARVLELVKTAPTIKPGDRLASAAALMIEYSVQAVAVVNQGHALLGLISEDDILQAALNGAKREPTKVGRIFSSSIA